MLTDERLAQYPGVRYVNSKHRNRAKSRRMRKRHAQLIEAARIIVPDFKEHIREIR